MRRPVFSNISDDLLHNILSRLPAASFAAAACVSTSWNRLCNNILSRPKLASAIALHPLPLVALDDAVEKVLSEPIRPHFVIVSAGEGYDLYQALPIMAKKFGSRTPVVLSAVSGIIGRDAMTDEFKEVKYASPASDEDEVMVELNQGIMVTVGFVPGLVVDAIPLICGHTRSRASAIEEFVTDIKGFTASISGSTSPLGIMMFGASWVNQKSVIELFDYAMDVETVIVGHERDRMMLCRSSDKTRNMRLNTIDQPDSIALVFAKDRQKAPGLDIQFHVVLSNGLSPIGPNYKAASVKERGPASSFSTWLTAKREGERQVLDGQQILDDIDNELQDRITYPDLYIGVTKKRAYSIGSEKPKTMTSLAFHGVTGGDEQYLYVGGTGIKTGDYFRFYNSDPVVASATLDDVSTTLRNLNLGWNSSHASRSTINNPVKEAFGGFIYGCCGRGEPFFEKPNVDSSPFLENFPGMPFGGIFCCGEIGRGCLNSPTNVLGLEETSPRQCLHVYSTIYLVMSYTCP